MNYYIIQKHESHESYFISTKNMTDKGHILHYHKIWLSRVILLQHQKYDSQESSSTSPKNMTIQRHMPCQPKYNSF